MNKKFANWFPFSDSACVTIIFTVLSLNNNQHSPSSIENIRNIVPNFLKKPG